MRSGGRGLRRSWARPAPGGWLARRVQGRQLHAGRPDAAWATSSTTTTASPAIVHRHLGGRRRRLGARPPPRSPRSATRSRARTSQFLMLDSSLNSTHGKFVGTPGSADLPVLADELQLVGRALGVTTTGGSVRRRHQDLDGRLSRPDRRLVRAEEEQEGEPHRGAQRRARRQARAGRRSGREGHADRLPGSRKQAASSRRSTTRRRSRRSSPTSAWSATRRAASARSR